MVSQPAYVSALKDYARRRPATAVRTTAELRETVKELTTESDRGAIILAATNVEDALEVRILRSLPRLHHDNSARKRIFEADGLLATFSSKIDMAYAMGLIDRLYTKKIHLIREIRNACAHCRMPLSMKHKVLRDPCEVLIMGITPPIEGADAERTQLAFLLACALISTYVITGNILAGTSDEIFTAAKAMVDKVSIERARRAAKEGA